MYVKCICALVWTPNKRKGLQAVGGASGGQCMCGLQDSWWRLCVISCRLLLHWLLHCLGLSLAAEEENKERLLELINQRLVK